MPAELKNLFQYMEEQATGDALTERIDAAVQQARILGKWRREYMTLQDYLQREHVSGQKEGRKEERANTLREKKRADAAEKRADAAEAKADSERTRADKAESKVKELEARLKELGG